MNGTPAVYDALIVGGGPAGLSTALGLARQLYTAVLFDSQQYRNYPADHMHNVITWDHRAPAEFRASAKEDITSRYKSIDFRTSRIENMRKLEDGTFEAVDSEHNKIVGKKVVVATGVTDILPNIKGFSALWGKSMYVGRRLWAPSILRPHTRSDKSRFPLSLLSWLRGGWRLVRRCDCIRTDH
jgi:thioredoxin reductase